MIETQGLRHQTGIPMKIVGDADVVAAVRAVVKDKRAQIARFAEVIRRPTVSDL